MASNNSNPSTKKSNLAPPSKQVSCRVMSKSVDNEEHSYVPRKENYPKFDGVSGCRITTKNKLCGDYRYIYPMLDPDGKVRAVTEHDFHCRMCYKYRGYLDFKYVYPVLVEDGEADLTKDNLELLDGWDERTKDAFVPEEVDRMIPLGVDRVWKSPNSGDIYIVSRRGDIFLARMKSIQGKVDPNIPKPNIRTVLEINGLGDVVYDKKTERAIDRWKRQMEKLSQANGFCQNRVIYFGNNLDPSEWREESILDFFAENYPDENAKKTETNDDVDDGRFSPGKSLDGSLEDEDSGYGDRRKASYVSSRLSCDSFNSDEFKNVDEKASTIKDDANTSSTPRIRTGRDNYDNKDSRELPGHLLVENDAETSLTSTDTKQNVDVACLSSEVREEIIEADEVRVRTLIDNDALQEPPLDINQNSDCGENETEISTETISSNTNPLIKIINKETEIKTELQRVILLETEPVNRDKENVPNEPDVDVLERERCQNHADPIEPEVSDNEKVDSSIERENIDILTKEPEVDPDEKETLPNVEPEMIVIEAQSYLNETEDDLDHKEPEIDLNEKEFGNYMDTETEEISSKETLTDLTETELNPNQMKTDLLELDAVLIKTESELSEPEVNTNITEYNNSEHEINSIKTEPDLPEPEINPNKTESHYPESKETPESYLPELEVNSIETETNLPEPDIYLIETESYLPEQEKDLNETESNPEEKVNELLDSILNRIEAPSDDIIERYAKDELEVEELESNENETLSEEVTSHKRSIENPTKREIKEDPMEESPEVAPFLEAKKIESRPNDGPWKTESSPENYLDNEKITNHITSSLEDGDTDSPYHCDIEENPARKREIIQIADLEIRDVLVQPRHDETAESSRHLSNRLNVRSPNDSLSDGTSSDDAFFDSENFFHFPDKTDNEISSSRQLDYRDSFDLDSLEIVRPNESLTNFIPLSFSTPLPDQTLASLCSRVVNDVNHIEGHDLNREDDLKIDDVLSTEVRPRISNCLID